MAKGTGLEIPAGAISVFHLWPVRRAVGYYLCPGLRSSHSPESKMNTSEHFI